MKNNTYYLRRNMRLFPAIMFVQSMMIFDAVMVPFFRNYDINQFHMMLIQAFFAWSVFCFEWPTGTFADKHKRIWAIRLGYAISACSFALYGFSHSFWAFAGTEVIMALGVSLRNGAYGAQQRETAQALGLDYSKFIRKQLIISSCGGVVGGLLGGAVANHLGIVAPMFFQAAAYVICVCLSMLLREAPRDKSASFLPADSLHKVSLKTIIKITRKHHPELWSLMIAMLALSTFTYNVAWLLQPYYSSRGVALSYFGILAALIEVGHLVGYAFTLPLARKFGRRKVLGLCSITAVCMTLSMFIGLPIVLISLPALLMGVTRSMCDLVTDSWLHDLMTDDVRARLPSVMSMMSRVAFSLTGLIVSLVVGKSLYIALIGITALLGGASILAWRNIKAKNREYAI
jgi:MFS family permease